MQKVTCKCRACRGVVLRGLPDGELPMHDPRRHKLLNDTSRRIVIRRMNRAVSAVEIPTRLATNDMRRARLRAIRLRMGMTALEFSKILHTSLSFYQKMEYGYRKCPIVYVSMAEERLRRFKSREATKKRRERIVAKVQPSTSVEMEISDSDRTSIISMFIRGKDTATIARELSLRPEIVVYCTRDLAD